MNTQIMRDLGRAALKLSVGAAVVVVAVAVGIGYVRLAVGHPLQTEQQISAAGTAELTRLCSQIGQFDPYRAADVQTCRQSGIVPNFVPGSGPGAPMPAPAKNPDPGMDAFQIVVAANEPGKHTTANPIPGIPSPEEWIRQWQAHHHGADHAVQDTEAEREICYHMLRSSSPQIRAEAATCPRGDRQ